MKKTISLIVILVAIFAAVFTSYAAQTTANTKVFKFGELMPLTGFGAPYGLALSRGLALAVEDLNAAGGIKVGTDRYQVKIIRYDTKGKPGEAKAAAERLIFKDKVKFIHGACLSPTTLAVQPVTEPNKVLIFTTAAAKQAYGAHKPYSFGPYYSVPARARVLIKYIRDTYPDARRFAIINPDVESGRTDYEMEKRFLKESDFEEVGSQFYPQDTKDFYPILSRILTKKPDVISLGNSFKPGIILKQLGELGYSGIKMSNIPAKANLVYKAAGKASEGLLISDEDFSSGGKFITPEKQRLYDNFVKKHGKKAWTPIVRCGYTLGQIVSQALEGAGTFDTTEVMNYLLTPDNPIHSLMGTWKVGPPGNRMAYHPIPISRLEKDKFVTIDILPNPVPKKLD